MKTLAYASAGSEGLNGTLALFFYNYLLAKLFKQTETEYLFNSRALSKLAFHDQNVRGGEKFE